jgi:hypothetical protein
LPTVVTVSSPGDSVPTRWPNMTKQATNQCFADPCPGCSTCDPLRPMTKQATSNALRPVVYPTGLRKWNLPDSSLSILWLGPGAGLHLAFDADKPGGSMTSINSPGSDGTYRTVKDAQKAVDTFVARCREQEEAAHG